MKKAVAAYHEFKWTWAFGAFCGAVLAMMLAPNLERWLYAAYDSVNPVVRMHGTIVGYEYDAVLIRVSGEKLRDCPVQEKSLQSYTLRNGVYFDAFESKVEGDTSSRPVGKVDLGVWRVWPTKAGTHVIITVNHRCDGRLITSEIARVPL